jgi:hypothetical protein
MTAAAEFPTFQAPVIVVRDAARVVLRHLDALPHSDERERLREIVLGCTRSAEDWSASPPRGRDVDALMKRLLAVHVQVARLEYDRSVGEPGGTAI